MSKLFRNTLYLISILTCGWVLFAAQVHAELESEFEFIEDLTPEGGESEDFGLGARIFGDELFVAWPHGFGNPAPAPGCGEVYYYKKNADGRFELLSILQSPDCSPGDMFGASDMALEGDTLFISALSGLRGDGQGSPGDSRVWVFERDAEHNPGDINEGWRPTGDLKGSRVGGSRAMGGFIDLEGDTLAVQSVTFESVFGFNFARADGIYIFNRDGETWTETNFISESTAFFGLGFELTTDQLIVGAPEAQTFGGAGKVYVYDRVGDDFVLGQTLTAGPEFNFGYFVDVQDDRMAIGAVNLAEPGAVFAYRRDGSSQWQADGKLTPPNRAANDIYGVYGEFAGDVLLIGAENGKRQSDPAAGKVYIYTFDDQAYQLAQELTAPIDSTASDVFGGALTSNGTDILVKAFGSPAGGFTGFYHFQREGGPSTPPDPDFEITLGHSGLFFNPERDGEGFIVDMLPDGRGLMLWFTYHQGEPLWMIAQGPVEENMIMMNEVHITRGHGFGAAYDPGSFELIPWGSLVLEFDDCDNGRVSYFNDLEGFEDGVIELMRLSNIAGIDCGETQSTVANGFSGGFYNPMRNGEGLQVHITNLNGTRTPVVYWPTYDNDSNQIWLLGMGEIEGDSIILDELYSFSGTGFGSEFSSEALNQTVWGSARVDYDGCDSLTLTYDSVQPGFDSGTLDMTRLYQLGLTSCNGTPSAQ